MQALSWMATRLLGAFLLHKGQSAAACWAISAGLTQSLMGPRARRAAKSCHGRVKDLLSLSWEQQELLWPVFRDVLKSCEC